MQFLFLIENEFLVILKKKFIGWWSWRLREARYPGLVIRGEEYFACPLKFLNVMKFLKIKQYVTQPGLPVLVSSFLTWVSRVLAYIMTGITVCLLSLRNRKPTDNRSILEAGINIENVVDILVTCLALFPKRTLVVGSLPPVLPPPQSPGWTSDLRCSFFCSCSSCPVSCCSSLRSQGEPWTWFITLPCLWLLMDPLTTTRLCLCHLRSDWHTE